MPMLSTRKIAAFAVSIALVTLLSGPAQALNIGGSPIAGGNPDFVPLVSADFSISGQTLTLVLTYEGTAAGSDPLDSLSQVLTGVLFDLEGYSGTLSYASATLSPGSVVVPPGSGFVGSDLTNEWYFGEGLLGNDETYGVGTMGDILFGADSFAVGGNAGGGGQIDFGILYANAVDFSTLANCPGQGCDVPSGFKQTNLQPWVEDSVTFEFDFTGSLGEDQIANVRALFGTDGAPLIPEPSAALLFFAGAVVLRGSVLRGGRRR